MERFGDIRKSFSTLLRDPQWLSKVILSGFLLINPFLLIFLPLYADPEHPKWVKTTLIGLVILNSLTFWFPLGFTYEVLRRAKTGCFDRLPDWDLHLLPRYFKEGSVKFLIAIFTLILPCLLWALFCWAVFVAGCGLDISMMGLFMGPAFVLTIPFCGVACCRWLDGDSPLNCALNYARNWALFKRAWRDYLIASCILTGLNAMTTAFYYTIPFGVVFGLCIVDTWFGPIYASTTVPEKKRAPEIPSLIQDDGELESLVK